MIQDSIQEIAQHCVVNPNPNGLCSSCVVEAIHNKGWAEYIAYSEKLKKTNEERLKILQELMQLYINHEYDDLFNTLKTSNVPMQITIL